MKLFKGALLVACVWTTIWADTVELKTGERIEGTFQQATAATTVIQVAGQAVTIPSEKVQAIYFGVVPARPIANQNISQEAMDALRGLRSVAVVGITYRDYSQRVLDAKVKIDRYLSAAESNNNTELREAIRAAMLEYELASQGWLAGSSPVEHGDLWGPMGTILESQKMVSACPVAKAMTDLRNTPPPPQGAPPTRKAKYAPTYTPTTVTKQDPTEELGMLFALRGNAPNTIWPCASQQVAEAERLLAQQR